MVWNSDAAAKILDAKENAFFIEPKIKYTHRYKIRNSAGTRHLAIAKERKGETVTAYINRFSLHGESFQDGVIDGVSAAEFYPKGHKGKTGHAGISSSVARLETLNPSTNEVVRIHIDSPFAFEKLVDWYSGDTGLIPSPQNGVQTPLEPVPIPEATIPTANVDKDGPNYQLDPKRRKCIEEYAVKWAKKHYEAQGFSVEERGKPFDLLCKKLNLIVHAEAKGTTGSGNKVILTRNEVIDARNPEWRSDLFIVYDIHIDETEDTYAASGGKERSFEAWQPRDADLSPLEYEYWVPIKP
jgi:hypothetical protein